MKKLLFFTVLLAFLTGQVRAQDGKFTFTISQSANTSAGVFRDDSILVKTLWSNVYYKTGSYKASWDGKDDFGKIVNTGDTNFQVKVLSSNVKYQWQGVLGNTSNTQTGSGVHRGYYHCMRGLVFTNGYGYYCRGYAEGAPSLAKFSISNPQKKIDFANSKQPGSISYVATDHIKVYWAVADAFADNNTFVAASKVVDDSDFYFSKGKSYTITFGKTYSAMSLLNQGNSRVSGLAVQKNGIYIFVARSGINQLQILNKTTGELIRTLSYTAPKSLCVDKNDNLWMVSGNGVAKYTVNSDGSLSAPTLKLAGLLKPAAIQVTTDGTLISVADDSTSQQVKFYNNLTGAASGVLGEAGGYFASPDVNNNKFYFNDRRSDLLTFIAYQPDGSFWVGDPGNFRAQHYTSSRTFIDNIQSMGATYRTGVDKNNITRVFADNMEFSVDYNTQILSGSAGWKLVKNWGASIPLTPSPYGDSPKFPMTLKNGRTYALLLSGYNYEVVELPKSGQLRYTGVKIVGMTSILCEDGSLQDCTIANSTCVIKKFPLVGFDALNNPIWSTVPEILASAPTLSTGNPAATPRTQAITSSNKVVFYNPNAYSNLTGPVFSTGFHLGIMNRGGKDWLVQTEKSTFPNYSGDFPNSGYFDVGNGVNNYAGGNVNVVDRNIITSYHGEFWKSGQTNIYNHYWDNGLAVGQYGTTRSKTKGEAAPMMAGNALTPLIVKDSAGDYYLYHGDESDHAGVHRWKITGLNTITEQVINLAAVKTYNSAIGYVDLMKGLPWDSIMPTNRAGWTRYPAANSLIDRYTNQWTGYTGRLKHDKLTSPDILLNFVKSTKETYYISRDLGTNNIGDNWKISGRLGYPSNKANGISISQYLEVLDSNGKILARFYPALNRTVTPFTTQIYGNNKVIASGSETTIREIMGETLPFEIKVVKGIVTFSYGNYAPVSTSIFDATGNWKTPKTLRCIFYSEAGLVTMVYGHTINLQDFKFYKDYLPVPGVNKPPVVDAGNDIVINLPTSSLTFKGSASDSDGVVTRTVWSKISGPSSGTITSPTALTTGVTGLTIGIYTYQLTATDDKGAISKDTVQVTVVKLNTPPVVNAGTDITITYPTLSTTLSGNASDIDNNIIRTTWRNITAAGSYFITAPDSKITSLTGLIPGFYKFELTVTDDKGAVVKDTVNVTIKLSSLNKLPVANAGPDRILTMPGNNCTLYGSASDPDGTVKSSTWTKLSGPVNGVIAAPKNLTTIIYDLPAGVYLFELAVMDNSYGVRKDTVKVTVNVGVNIPPVAKAGEDQNLTMPWNNTVLNGFGSDIDGTITLQWSKISGPAPYFLHTPTTASTGLGLLEEGVYVFELKVTDNKGAIKRDTMKVNVGTSVNTALVKNQLPVANAGVDKVINLPTNSVTLTGSALDSDGSVVSYAWAKVAGTGTFTIGSPTSLTTTISNLIEGTYQFSLRVKDNAGAYGSDFVQVTVKKSTVTVVNRTFSISETVGTSVDSSAHNVPMVSSAYNDFKVYPNPVKDVANLDIAAVNGSGRITVSVMNIAGMQVMTKEIRATGQKTNYILDMSTLKNGVYVIILRFEDGSIINKKVIKEGTL